MTTSLQEEVVHIPKKLRVLLSTPMRYKVAYGGRGSTKSWTFARVLLIRGVCEKLRILCTREMQNSIKDSVYRLLCDQIVALHLEDEYDIYHDTIISKITGTEFIFKGLKHNINEIKSIEGIDICWVEEAQNTSEESWVILIPSIRKPGSEIWVSFNPEDENSATDMKFIKHPPTNARIVEINYDDNPWFGEPLKSEMEHDKRVDYDKWLHVWKGKYKTYSDALIFKSKFRVEEFDTPPNTQFYYGADFGFSSDPTALVRCFIMGRKHDNKCITGCRSQHLRLFIDYEAYGHGVELDQLHQFFYTVPEAHKWQIRADSSRPDTISFLKRPSKDNPPIMGYNIIGAEKGKNSVEDGIQFLRSFEEIIAHPRCRGTKDNFENYKWKVDKITKLVLPIPVDANNHVPDALRYALEPYIKAKTTIYDVPNWARMA